MGDCCYDYVDQCSLDGSKTEERGEVMCVEFLRNSDSLETLALSTNVNAIVRVNANEVLVR